MREACARGCEQGRLWRGVCSFCPWAESSSGPGWTAPWPTPHLQSILQVCLEPLPVVRHRPASARPCSRRETLGYSPIQVGSPAAGLGHLQEETVGSARLVWGTEVSPAPVPQRPGGGRALHPVQPFPQILCPSELPKVLAAQKATPGS